MQDAFDALDLSDNELVRLDHFPIMRRLSSLYVSNNLISRISSSISTSLPNLHTLVLTNNRVTALTELDFLVALRDLRFLSLMHNPVTRKQHYRYYVVHTLPQLRMLDFNRISKKERIAAAKFFLSKLGKVFLQELGVQRPLSATTVSEAASAPSSIGFTSDELVAIKAAINATTSAKEIEELECALRDGKIPLDRFRLLANVA
jgi:U2 small nuclear ribonucleoprotein A'